MNKTNTDTSSVYTPELIELVRLGVAFVTLLEQGQGKRQIVGQLLQLLPRLYTQTLLQPAYLFDWEMDYIEEYVTEDGYDHIRQRLAHLLGDADAFLVPSLEDGVYDSDYTQLTISECVADVYQHLGNLLGIIRAENTEAVPAAIGRYLLLWREHWGRQLLLALPALHEIYCALGEEEDDEEAMSEDAEPNIDDSELDFYSDLDDSEDKDL